MNRRDFLVGGAAALGSSAMASPVKGILGASGVEYVEEEKRDYTASDYVQDGLVAMWDGIENSGYGEHSDTLKTWVDLTGNGNDMPVGGYTILDDGVVFNNARSPDYFGTRALTPQIEVVLVPDASANYNQNVIAPYGSGPYARFIIIKRSNRLIVPLAYSNFQNWGCRCADITDYDGIPVAVSIRWGYCSNANNSRNNAYINGIENVTILDSAASVGFDYCTDNGKMHIGFEGSLTNYKTKTVKCIRLYNRELSPKEVRYNYEIDKRRFGL
jgi:hypothetical protein